MGNNLKRLRIDRGWTHQEAAERMGVSRSQLIKLERGERRLTQDYISMAAAAFQVDDAEIIAERKSVMLVGYVGAGAEAHFYAEAQGPFEEVPAPPGSTDQTVGVEVRGTSLGRLFDRWIVYYDDRRSPITRDMLGKVCVVALMDGKVLVKEVLPGQLPGRYTLYSQVEAPIYDAEIEWAALVTHMSPR